MPEAIQTRKQKMPKQSGAAFFRPGSVDAENRTVEVVMTTGESGKRYDWYNDRTYLEELQISAATVRQERLKKGIPVITDHSRWSGVRGVIGTTEDYRIENGELIGTLRFSKRDDVEEIFKDIADGILRNVSLGYKVHKYERIRAKNDGELDTYRAVDIEPLELSLVQVPFESTNGVRAERQDSDLYEVEIEDRAMPNEQIVQPETEQKPNEPEQRAEAPVSAPETINKVDKPAETNVRAELPAFMEAARHAGLDIEFATTAFTEGRSIDEFRADCLVELGKRNKGDDVTTQGVDMSFKSDKRQDEYEQTKRDMENALEHIANPATAMTDGGKRFAGMTLCEMGRSLLESQGISTVGLSKMALAERALHSTSDFPLLLANVMNKGMRSAYQEVPRTFMEFGRRASVSDFRPVHRMALGDAPDLKKLNEHGEFTRGTMSEEGESYKIATYGRIFGITRQTLINDDLNALTRLSSMWAASSARLQNRLFWGMILGYDFEKGAAAPYLMADGNNVFYAGGNNLATGAGSAFGEAAFSAMRKAGRKQKTIDGKNMNVAYTKLAIPAELETQAEKLLLQTIVPNTVADTSPFKGKFSFVVEPLLDEVSTTAWYAFANTNAIDTFEYAFLQGEEELNIETRQGFDIDGFEVRARTDVGGGWVDRRGAYKANGA